MEVEEEDTAMVGAHMASLSMYFPVCMYAHVMCCRLHIVFDSKYYRDSCLL